MGVPSRVGTAVPANLHPEQVVAGGGRRWVCYQVIKKWLSYREKGADEKPLLGRPITKEEARYVTEMARRIAALLLMGAALDANYEAVKRDPCP
jgi:hypothetical protein